MEELTQCFELTSTANKENSKNILAYKNTARPSTRSFFVTTTTNSKERVRMTTGLDDLCFIMDIYFLTAKSIHFRIISFSLCVVFCLQTTNLDEDSVF